MQEDSKTKGNCFALVLTAGGLGQRMGENQPKQFLKLQGRPILAHALDCLPGLLDLGLNQLVLSHPAGHEASTRLFLQELHSRDPRFHFASKQEPAAYESATCTLHLCEGGITRQDSVRHALEILEPLQPSTVFVHDAVRPLASVNLFSRLLENAKGVAGVVPLLAVVDTLKRVGENLEIIETVDREEIYRVQTPQCFAFQPLLDAHRKAQEAGFFGTDDASLFEWMGDQPVLGVQGEERNLKLTTPEDLALAAYWLGEKA
jgi:2-C-methyl-D-erythritol 4-phosphate cytidylyltransferase